LANLSSGFYISNVVSGNVWAVTNVVPEIETGDNIICINSGAFAQVSLVTRSGIAKSMETFVSMFKYIAAPVSGSFQQNEQVYQGSSLTQSTANAALFAAIANSGQLNIYVSNQVGHFANIGIITTINGANSAAIATLGQEWSPEVIFGSGKAVYIENIGAVQRANTTSDNLTVIVNF
jgi:hypothetical protein